MNEQTITQDRLAEEIDALLAPYPDPMSRNDFRIACHIGTRTSLYLLQSGLVPCLHTGKRTRCYKIAKADVAAYLRRRLTEPEYYAPPSGWYKNYPQRKPPAVSLTRTLDYEIVSRLHGFPLVHRGPPAHHPAPSTVYGAESLAAGLSGIG